MAGKESNTMEGAVDGDREGVVDGASLTTLVGLFEKSKTSGGTVSSTVVESSCVGLFEKSKLKRM